MDPLMDYDIAEINFRPRNKGRKSYARDSHGFELENNYFQDSSSEEETSSSSEGSFSLSLKKDAKQSQQQQLSNQHGMTAMLPSGTRSNKSSHYSPSPLKTYNHSPAKATINPKKRLTFDADSNEENRKNQVDESVSESEEDNVTVAAEILPRAYSPTSLNPAVNKSTGRYSSTHKKSAVKSTAKSLKPKSSSQSKPVVTSQAGKSHKSFQLVHPVTANNGKKMPSFDLGDFSDSSSDTDEDVEGIKRSLFVRPIGKDSLMCLPKLSEYIRPREKAVGDKKKESQPKEAQRRRNEKRKASAVATAPTAAKRKRKNVRMIEKEMTPIEESTATSTEESTADDEEMVRAVKTQRNPKLSDKKKKSSVSVVQRSTTKKQKPVAKKPYTRRHNRSAGSPVSDSSQKSFAVLQDTTSKIIDSIYGADEQDLEDDMRNEIGQSVQQVSCRPSISFTSKGEKSRQNRSSTNKKTQDVDPCVPDAMETDTTLQNSRKRHTEAEKEQHHHDNDIMRQDHREQRRSPRLLSSEEGLSDSSTVRLIEKQQKPKKKTRQRPPKEVDINKNKEQFLHKDNKKKRKPRDAKRRELIEQSRSLSRDQGYVHVPVAKVEPQAVDNNLRRSSRTRVPRINHLLGEQLIYEASASGGMVVKEIIKPTLSSSQCLIFQKKPSKVATKHNKQSSSNNASQTSKSYSKPAVAKVKEPKHQEVSNDEDEQVNVKKKPHKKPSQKTSNPKSTLISTDVTNPPIAMVDPITIDDSRHFKSKSVNKNRAGGHREEVERKALGIPISPRNKESFGSTLMKYMFQSDSSLATESVEIIGDDGTVRPPVEVIKPLQSLRLCNASGSTVTPDDPFIMAILSRQKNSNFGIAILNKMGDKGEQYTSDSSVCFFLISGEIIVKIGDLELHPPVWSRIYVPEGVSYTLRNLQHTPAVLSYIVIKPDREANRERDPSREGEDD